VSGSTVTVRVGTHGAWLGRHGRQLSEYQPERDLAVNVTVGELMTAGHVADLMRKHKVSALPVVDSEGAALGIVTASDLLADRSAASPVSNFMSAPAFTVPATEGPHVAARLMRNHHLHHVVVVEQHRVVGIVSTYDLLALVEDHRYTAKQAPTPARRKPNRQ
jgi:CBS domain-containing protein